MKRHPSLAHLSRDHHGALLLARLLQKNAPVYNGLPADVAGKAAYALNVYHKELVPHFAAEEHILQWVTGINGQLDLLVQTIYREHQELHQLFSNFPAEPALESYLDTTGKALEIHIRKEERELFPLMQEWCNEATMDKINSYLSPQEN
ncbi:MAG: Hemerythrin cation binding domain protein [Ferruginibacter sp.]|uniref:hemerythrin domain-containing protein n=1 Tax=Ferruginibacter sp. TaxID=1940288 RepID=UPI002657FF5B|nr:hemerythrin domain-containing protein [Ferruginibacter sp.]MDB5278248.1 Hemerythrin cation binding domain protein [Ferruginibacter sp.]